MTDKLSREDREPHRNTLLLLQINHCNTLLLYQLQINHFDEIALIEWYFNTNSRSFECKLTKLITYTLCAYARVRLVRGSMPTELK